MTDRFTTYAEFWPHYLGEHRRPATRICHFAGTISGLVLLVIGLLTADPRWVAAALVAGYGPAWLSHAAIEHNKPATFRYPIWSLISDLRMAILMTMGRLNREIERYKIN